MVDGCRHRVTVVARRAAACRCGGHRVALLLDAATREGNACGGSM